MTTSNPKLTKGQIIMGVAAFMVIVIVLWIGQGFLKKEERGLFPSLADSSFSLITHEGKTITNKDLIGKPTAIYFGFTWCLDGRY